MCISALLVEEMQSIFLQAMERPINALVTFSLIFSSLGQVCFHAISLKGTYLQIFFVPCDVDSDKVENIHSLGSRNRL